MYRQLRFLLSMIISEILKRGKYDRCVGYKLEASKRMLSCVVYVPLTSRRSEEGILSTLAV
jgi:hypothetical protein